MKICVTLVIALMLFVSAGCSGPSPFRSIRSEPIQPLPETPVEKPLLSLMYPEIGPLDSTVSIAALDSVFLFGNVADPEGRLTIAGEEIPLYSGGRWLAWVGFEECETWTDSSGVRRTAGRVTIRYDLPGGETPDYTRTLWFLQPKQTVAGEGILDVPFSARLTVIKDGAPIRCGWPGTYDLFALEGTVVETDGYRDSGRRFYRLPLGGGEVGWIEGKYVNVDLEGPPPRASLIHYVTAKVRGRSTIMRIPLNGDLPPVRVEQVADDRLELTIYNAMSWTDMILQPSQSRAVKEIRWRQVDPVTYRLTAFIRPGWFWGWSLERDTGGALLWTIREAPELKRKPLDGLRIVLDPGHGGGNLGAVGPSGVREKQLTLPLAQTVAAELKKAGAEVFLTRESDIAVDLDSRIESADQDNADIVISLHFNGLPQGRNPFLHHGTSVHYYHHFTRDMAADVLAGINKAVGWKGNGLRYQDLAIPRLTRCPSVLVETAFLLHPEEEDLAGSEQFRKQFARGLRNGLTLWLKDLKQSRRNDPANRLR